MKRIFLSFSLVLLAVASMAQGGAILDAKTRYGKIVQIYNKDSVDNLLSKKLTGSGYTAKRIIVSGGTNTTTTYAWLVINDADSSLRNKRFITPEGGGYGMLGDSGSVRGLSMTDAGVMQLRASSMVFATENGASNLLNLTSTARIGFPGITSPTAAAHFSASSTSRASGRIPSGTAPTSPNHGDFWTDTDHHYERLNGVTYQFDRQMGRTDVTVSSSGTIAMSVLVSDYVASGTTSTWTLPAVSGNTGKVFWYKNRGSGNVTLNSNAGGNDIYDTSASNTKTISAGTAGRIVNDGTYWLIYNF